MMKVYRAPTATTADPHVFKQGDEVVISATDQIGRIVKMSPGPEPMAHIELDGGGVTEVPAASINPFVPKDEPDTWVDVDRDHPKVRTTISHEWAEPAVQWLKTFAHQSAWVSESLFQTTHEVGEIANGPLGLVRVKAIGHSPMGVVYRVEPLQGGEQYDLMEEDLRAPTSDRAMALAAADPYQGAYQYVFRNPQGNPGGTFTPDMKPFEAASGFMSGMRGLGDSEEAVTMSEFSPEAIKRYHTQWMDAMRQNHLYLGIWHSNEQMYFDLAVYLPTRETAIMHCIDHVQQAAYDLATDTDLEVLSEDRTQVLPEIVAEFDGADLQARLQEALQRWGIGAPGLDDSTL
jgi:hypothetical protein